MLFDNLDQIGISVVICCHNSAERIIPTLEHLSRQQNIAFPWEILLIDNNSSDNTKQVALDFWGKTDSNIPLVVIPEPRPGTMYARKIGIKSASFRYLLYCDDDNWLNEHYLTTAFKTITPSEDIAAVGGKGILVFDSNQSIPGWVETFQNNLGAGPQGKEDGDTTHVKGCLYTAGAILDRKWLDKLYRYGFTSSLKGRDGKSLVAGEDTELTYALKLIGGKLYYSSEMQFRHYMPPQRITWNYLMKLNETFGYSDLLISPYNFFWQRKRIPSFIEVLITTIKNSIIITIRAISTGFTEGNSETLRFYRIKGTFKALLSKGTIYINNKRQVLQLVKKSSAK